jgi:acetyl-CoA acetyltransferase
MRDVAILGVGLHPYGKFDDKPLTHIYRGAVEPALKDAGVKWRDIQAIAAAGSRHSGGLGWAVNGNEVASEMGPIGVPIYNLMAGCAAGAFGFNVGHTLIASGMYDLVLVIGAEKMPRGFITQVGIEDPNDPAYIEQVCVGRPGPAFWALMTQRRMIEYGTTEETLAKITVKDHKNGRHNPNARYRQDFTVEDVLNSPMVLDPLHLYEICAVSDGAAAAVLASPEVARRHTTKPVWLTGCALGSVEFSEGGGLAQSTEKRRDTHDFVNIAVRKAFAQAGMTPKDVDFMELQDNIVTYELTLPEEWGFVEPGEADAMVQRGETGPTGKLPINPSGGFNCFGEATTAMGVFEVCEATWQLRGQKGATQVPDAKVGLTQTIGMGGNGSCFILKR